MILVTGAAGNTGFETARHLLESGQPVRAMVRSAEKGERLKALGANVVVGDLTDGAFVKSALDGVSKAMLVMPNIEQQLELETAFVDAAAAAGLKHFVYLSSLESVPENENPITQMHVATEEHLRKSGLPWTMVRPTFFMQLFLAFSKGIRETGTIKLPTGSGTVAATDVRDVGAFISHVLGSDGHINKSYDVTGPQLLDFNQIAQIFTDVLGKPVSFVDEPIEEFRSRFAKIQPSPWRVDAVCKEFQGIAAGIIDHTTATFAEIMGRQPTPLSQFIEDYRTVFTGSP